jgi:hypothetical protein
VPEVKASPEVFLNFREACLALPPVIETDLPN